MVSDNTRLILAGKNGGNKMTNMTIHVVAAGGLPATVAPVDRGPRERERHEADSGPPSDRHELSIPPGRQNTVPRPRISGGPGDDRGLSPGKGVNPGGPS